MRLGETSRTASEEKTYARAQLVEILGIAASFTVGGLPVRQSNTNRRSERSPASRRGNRYPGTNQHSGAPNGRAHGYRNARTYGHSHGNPHTNTHHDAFTNAYAAGATAR